VIGSPPDSGAVDRPGGSGGPDLEDVVTRVRYAYAELAWHPALRRRSAEVHAEVLVRAASASAALEGARVPVEVLRAATARTGDPALDTGLAARRAMLVVGAAGARLFRSPAQVLARAHATAASGWVPDEQLGRPRPGAASQVQVVVGALARRPGLPTALVAADVQARLLRADAFPPVTGIIARAVARGVVTAGGLDVAGVGLPEEVAAGDPMGYRAAVRGSEGGRDEEHWPTWWCEALVRGAALGAGVGDEILSGVLGGGGGSRSTPRRR
jgi:hypothetical protein